MALEPSSIFALYVAANASLLLLLAILTVRNRLKNGVSIGDGGQTPMIQAIRAHGNASEYIPIGLVLLLALTMVDAPSWVLHLHGSLLTLGRVMHALGLYHAPGRTVGRFFGINLTWISMLIAIVGIVYYSAN